MSPRLPCALLFALLFALLSSLAVVPAASAQRAMWDTRLLARVGPPGYPAHAYVHPNGRIYEGTYVSDGSKLPSRVLEYDGDGTVLRSWTVPGQELKGEQGVQVATSDRRGRLVLLDHSPPRALLLDPRDASFTTYATFPAGVIPNYAAWGPDGTLYVTDYGTNAVWRVPPGGGAPAVWLRDPAFRTVEFGTTGIALGADRRTLFVAQQTSPAGGNPAAGGLFRVPITADGRAGAVTKVWTSGALDLPDGFAVGRDERFYVAALGPNQIVIVGADGREQTRWPPAPLLGENGSAVPFDALSSVAFRGTSLITASQSNPRGDASHWALHDVEVRAEGLPELIPAAAGVLPGEAVPGSALRVRATPVRVRAGARVRVRFAVTAAGVAGDAVPVRGALVRLAGGARRTAADGTVTLVARLRRPGVRRAVVTAPGLTRATIALRVLPR